jgi:hypothetical protein
MLGRLKVHLLIFKNCITRHIYGKSLLDSKQLLGPIRQEKSNGFGFGGSAMVGVVGGAIPLFLNILDFLLAL